MNPRIAAEIEQLRVEMARLDRLGFDSANIKVRLRNLLIEAGTPLDVINDLAGFHMQYASDARPVMYGEVADTSQFSQAIRDASQEAQDATGGQQPHFGEVYRQHPVHGILADFLADHGDPREHHARSPAWGHDVEHHLRHEVGLTPVGEADHPYTPESRRFVHNFGTEKEHVFPDGSRLWATPWGAGGNEFELSPSHQIPWQPTHLHTTWMPNAVGNYYHAPMSIDEFDDWVDQFPDDERARLRKTFGDRPQAQQYARQLAPTAYAQETDFYRAMAENPRDRNTLGVFADWAQDNNHPMAGLLNHLRDHGTPSQDWDWSQVHGDDYWHQTAHPYPHPQIPGYVRTFPMHEWGPLSLTISPFRDTDDHHYAEMAFEHPETGQWRAWMGAIPAGLGHETARRLAETYPAAEPFRDHLAKAQQERDAHAGREPQQYAAQDADGQPLGYGRTDYAGEFEALRSAIRREPRAQLHRNALADWLMEQGRDEEAAFAADHQYPVGFTADGRVGPGHFRQTDQDARSYASAASDAFPDQQTFAHASEFHPDAIAAIHHAVGDFRTAAGDDVLRTARLGGNHGRQLFHRRNGLRGGSHYPQLVSDNFVPGTPEYAYTSAAEMMGPHTFHTDDSGFHSSHDAPPEPEEQTQYAHDGPVTLGPGGDRGHRTPKGETLTTHDIQDEAGNALGDVRLHPSGDTLHVHWAGATGMASGEGRGPQGQPLGARHIRPLMSQIAGQYPDHVALSYVPAAGRLAAGQRRMQDLDDFRAPEAQVRNRPRTQVSSQPAARTPEWEQVYANAFKLFADHGFAEAEANRAAGGQQYAAQYADGQPIQPPPAQDPAARVAQLQKWTEMWRQRGADPSHFLAEIARLTGRQGPPPPAGYQDGNGRPLAYAATMYGPADDFHAMLSSPEHNATRWGHGDHNLRLVAADAYQEEGDEESANHLRGGGHVVTTPDRRVVPGRWNLFGVAHAAHQAATHIHNMLGNEEFNHPMSMISGDTELGGKPADPQYHAQEFEYVEPDPEPEGGVYPPHTMRLTVDNAADAGGYRTHTHFHGSEYPHRMADALAQTLDGFPPEWFEPAEQAALQQHLQSVRNVPAEVPDLGDGIHYSKGRKFHRAPKGGASVPIPKQYRGGQFVPAHYAPEPEERPADVQDADGAPVEPDPMEAVTYGLKAWLAAHGTEPRWRPQPVVAYAGGFAPADKFHLQDEDDQSVLADYLAENGDPRERLARSPHTADSAYDAVLPPARGRFDDRLGNRAIRMGSHKFPDGTEIAVRQYHDTLPVHVVWHGLRGLRQPHAVMTPEELSAWVSDFPEDEAANIRKSVGRHTPADKRIGLKPFVI